MKIKIAILFVLMLSIAVTGCKKKPELIVEELTQKYLYSLRDGKIEEVYNTMLSDETKKVVTLKDFNDYYNIKYKNKIADKLRASQVTIGREKDTGDILFAEARTSNLGREGTMMNIDDSFLFNIKFTNENNKILVNLDELTRSLSEERENKKRLEELLKNYQGLVKIDSLTGSKVPQRPGWAQLEGTILNGSEDLDMVRVGIKVKLKDREGSIIYAETFYPVVDMRVEGLRTSILPGEAKYFNVKIKDVPDLWDPNQPLEFEFYLIDGPKIEKEDLDKEIAERANLKKLIEETKKADEEAQRQLKNEWEKEKLLKEKIKDLQKKSTETK